MLSDASRDAACNAVVLPIDMPRLQIWTHWGADGSDIHQNVTLWVRHKMATALVRSLGPSLVTRVFLVLLLSLTQQAKGPCLRPLGTSCYGIERSCVGACVRAHAHVCARARCRMGR